MCVLPPACTLRPPNASLQLMLNKHIGSENFGQSGGGIWAAIVAPLLHHSQHAEPGASPGWRGSDPHKSNSPPEPLRLCLRYLWGPPPHPSTSAHPADEPGTEAERRLNTWTWSRSLIYSHFLMFPSRVCATFWSLSWSRPSCTRSGGKTQRGQKYVAGGS